MFEYDSIRCYNIVSNTAALWIQMIGIDIYQEGMKNVGNIFQQNFEKSHKIVHMMWYW